jgi:hypothetical protein
VIVRYLDQLDAPREVTLKRRGLAGLSIKFGEFPAFRSQIESRRLPEGIGYLRFNLFALPLLEAIREAVKSFRDAPGVIIDLRGNSGGEIAVTTAVAGLFHTSQTTLGMTRLRQGELHRIVLPNAAAYTGPLVILTDEGTSSAAETFAAAMQENGRARIVGRPTAGGALPSVIEKLPTGARLQYAIGEYRTPKGIVLEGRGVVPDEPVEITRRALLEGRDQILEKAITNVRAQEAAKALPPAITAEQVMEKHIAALGGRQALEKITSYELKAGFEMPGRGVQGTLEIYGKAPDKLLTIRNINRVGVIKQGYDGQSGWSEDPYQGLRSLAGEELEIARLSAVFNAELRWRELFAKAELTAMEAGAYVIRLTRKDGSFVSRRYDAKTFLLLREDALYEGPQGKLPIETRYADYREVDGVKLAFQWTQKTPVGETIIKIIEIRHNVEVDDARFTRPATAKP